MSNSRSPRAVRSMTIGTRGIARTIAEATYYTSQVIGPDGVPASGVSPCRQTRFGPTWTNFTDYRGNGTYQVVLRSFPHASCATATREQRYLFSINAGTSITP